MSLFPSGSELIAQADQGRDCGLVFQREEGYFLGAMYVSSVLSMAAAMGGSGTAKVTLSVSPATRSMS